MKTFLNIFLVLFCISMYAQDKKCNYIVDYYPLIYKGQLSYLKKQNDSAYYYFKQAEQKCELLFNESTREIETLAELEAENKNHPQAINYLRMLLKNGRKLSYFEENDAFRTLKPTKEWENLKSESNEIYNKWYNSLNLDLRKEIINMITEDQRVRMTKVSKEEYNIINTNIENRLKEILKTYGYPNQNLLGNFNLDKKHADIYLFAFHVQDIEYFKPLFFDYVKNGKSSPELYASMIDSNDRKRGIFTYRIYSNLKDSQIEDLPNLDQRRISVGLRPWKMQLEYEKLRNNFFNQ